MDVREVVLLRIFYKNQKQRARITDQACYFRALHARSHVIARKFFEASRPAKWLALAAVGRILNVRFRRALFP